MGEVQRNRDTRREFIDTLCDLAEKDDKIVFIIPDVGFNYTEKFQEKFPSRYFNLGVTEQSTFIIAAAMALDGFKPYVYSMINFVTFRVHEMIRNAICLHGANVKILGVKGSEKYKFLGFSHNLLSDTEDTDFMSRLPGMKCYVTTTPDEVVAAVKESYESDNPAYIRL